MKARTRRPPNAALIEGLRARGCTAHDWKRVLFHPETDPSLLRGAHFDGPASIGRLSPRDLLAFPGLPPRSPGLYGVRLSHVHLGDQVRLEDIGEPVRHVRVGDGSMVLRVEELSGDLESSFGVGAPVSVLNENGRRVFHLHDDMGLQWAWLEVFCKHDPVLQRRLARAAQARAAALRGEPTTIGNGVLIRACGVLRNVRIGDGARLRGAAHLEEGILHPGARVEGPAHARHFLMAPRSLLEGASRLEHSALGEGSEVAKGALVEHSLLFADTQFHAGEACAAWAGPHCISHHKATLLLAGAYSFFNAGSATNFSNHHYRLGPVHQGILERGTKTGSGSLLLFPSRVGAFSTIVGRHGKPLDSSDFPFSLLVGKDDRTLLYPGLLCFSSGQVRDEMKWPQRDRRGKNPADLFCPTRLTPLTAARALRGLERLREATTASDRSADFLDLGGLSLPRAHLATGIAQYEILLKAFVFETVLNRAARYGKPLPWPLFPSAKSALPEWVDWGGIPCPVSELERVIQGVRQGALKDPAAVRQKAAKILHSLESLTWDWVRRAAAQLLTPHSLAHPDAFLLDLRETLGEFYGRLLRDGEKEFLPAARIGYGLGGDALGDFNAVRGRASDDGTLQALEKARQTALRRARDLRFSGPARSGSGKRPRTKQKK
ncbi:MAG: DUF4954 family protein [Spirochaetes bacterium]|nr:DUF4954 family protein [Spirochaetota bacterium]